MGNSLRAFVLCTNCANDIVDPSDSFYQVDLLFVFPFERCVGLYREPPPNITDNGFLQVLSNAVLPQPEKGPPLQIFFRKTFNLPSIQTRVFTVYTANPAPEEEAALTAANSLYGKNIIRLKEFFRSSYEHGYVFTQEEREKFRDTCMQGDTLSVTVLNETGKEDTIIAAVQFQRSAFGAWINFLATTNKNSSPAMFGIKGGFLPANTIFRGTGIAFTLLRAVQLLQCSYGFSPSLFIQVKLETHLARYLMKLGFAIVKRPGLPPDIEDVAIIAPGFERWEEEYLPQATSGNGIVWRKDEGFVVLEISKVVAWSKALEWTRSLCDSDKYHHTKGSTGLSTYPRTFTLCNTPFATDGKFLDQSARGLTMLGAPFFYCADQERLAGASYTAKHFQRASIDGVKYATLESAELGGSTHYLTDDHIQFLINWIFRDEDNPATRHFHVVPRVVAAYITELFKGRINVSTMAKVLHKYCLENWRHLDCFMFYFVRNIGRQHFNLDIAVNPYRLLSKVAGGDSVLNEEARTAIYGLMHIDPLLDPNRDGTIPHTSQVPQDSPLHCREIIFLMNCLSRYRDLNIHGLLSDDFVPTFSIEWIMSLGAVGPFGKVFGDTEACKASELIWDAYPTSYFPLLKTQPQTLPVQTDGYNCGIYCILAILDLVLTQWH